jgi:hypothetical protein
VALEEDAAQSCRAEAARKAARARRNAVETDDESEDSDEEMLTVRFSNLNGSETDKR